MEYDKRNYQKTNDKKVLHKIRKHWVVVSTALLMALGGGAAATHVSANADTSANNGTATSTSTIKDRMNQQLQTPQKQNSQARPAVNNNVNNSQNNNSQNSNANIISQAKVLHNRILMNAGQNTNNSAQQSQTNGTSQNNAAAGQGRVAANAPKVNNNVHVNKPGNGISDIAKRMQVDENGGTVTANDNNNKVDNRRPRMMLGDAPSAPTTKESSVISNFSSQKDSNGNYYQPYSFVGASDLDSDNNDTDPSDYGAITVDYVDPSDNNLTVDNTTLSDVPGGTNFDKGYYLRNYPTAGNPSNNAQYGYSLATNGSNKPSDAIYTGSNINSYVSGENQLLVINLHRNQQKATNGNVLVQYLNMDDNDKVLSYRMNSNSDNQPFNQTPFINDIPQGYTYDHWNTVQNGIENPADSNGISKYTNNVQTLNVYVHQTNMPENDTIDYIVKGTNTIVASRAINGNKGQTIDYTPYNNYIPQGYNYASDADNNPQTFADNMPDAKIYVTPESNNNPNNSTNPKDIINNKAKQSGSHVKSISDGTITVHYENDADRYKGTNKDWKNDIKTVVLTGAIGSDMAPDMSKLANKSYLPAGWSDGNLTDQNTDTSDTSITFQPTRQDEYIYVNDYNSKSIVNPATATIQYMDYDPTSGKTTAIPNATEKVTGKNGTPINYATYDEFVPAGYHFLENGPYADRVIQQGETDDITVVKNDQLAEPIMVNYINGKTHQTVNDSHDSKNGLSGSYGTKYTDPQITTSTSEPMPSGYSLPQNEDNVSYTVNSDNQTANIIINGTEQGKGTNGQNKNHSTKPSDTNVNDPKNLVVHVNQRIVDPSGDVISNRVISDYSVVGNTGSDEFINPRDYMPTPNGDYTMDSHDQPDEFTIGNQELDPLNKNTNSDTQFIQDPSHKNLIDATFTYVQNTANATVTYEDESDGNNIVGSTTISGQPNTAMTDYYNGNDGKLDSDVPYGYQFDNATNPAQANPTNLENGANYIIYVKNSHLQPRPTVQPRQGYGYITIYYGHNLQSDGQGKITSGTIYSTVTTTNSDGSGFNDNSPIRTAANGGIMPDVYADQNPQETAGDNSVSQYKSKPQTFIVNVDGKDDATNTVSDDIDYEVLNSDGTKNSDATNKLSSKHLTPITIKGTDGTTINYEPYTSNVPDGYYYDGLATQSTIYNQGQNTPNNPVATVYLKQASENSNACKGYTPENDNNHQGKDATDVPKNEGYYYPVSNAPLTKENPNKPITKSGYSFNGEMPSDYEGDEAGGLVPDGYAPAWVKNASGTYTSGYVPSDIIPSDYIPGEVPNGKGGYVAGYVPSNPNNMPKGKNDGKKIPSYVPGKIPSGHKDSNGKEIYVPGYVPNIPQYSSNSGNIMIQYVDQNNQSDVISDVQANGKVGNSFDLTKDGSAKQYINDVPVGYTDPKVVSATNSDGQLQDTTQTNYQFSDGSKTIRIGLEKMVTGNVLYIDKKGYQVGSAQISGAEGDPVNLNNTEYTQLLPYGYNLIGVRNGNPSTLQNGADYIINVDNAHLRPARQPQQQKGYGQIIVNYVSTKTHQIVGTDSFIGQNGSSIQAPDELDIGKVASSDGYVPYGYTNPSGSDITNAQEEKFSATNTPETVTIKVDPDSNTYNIPVPNYTDQIAYKVVTKDGDETLDYTNGHTGIVVAGGLNDSGDPVTFSVTGKAGTDINYQPYETDVPSGYEPDGMGNHSAVFDKGHDGQGGAYDWLLLRHSPQTTSLGTITLNYYKDNSDNKNNKLDTITLHGISGTGFNLGYYEDNLPTSISDDDFVSASADPLTFNSNNQSVNITVRKPANAQASYSSVHVYFVKADALNTSDGNGKTYGQDLNSTDPNAYSTGAKDVKEKALVPNSQPEIMTGRVGDIFTPYAYEYNVPANTTFNHIAGGQNIDSFAQHDQDLFIAVDTTNGSF